MGHEFKMAHHSTRSGRCGGHNEMDFRQTRGGPIVHHITVFAQHQAVAHAPDFEAGEHVGVNKIKQFRRIWPLNIDLTQGRHITHANCVSHIAHFAVTRLSPRLFALDREIAGAIPQPRFHHRCAVFNRCHVAGGFTFGGKAFALCPCPESCHCNWAIRWAECCGPCFRNTAPSGIREQRKGCDV